jgi:hypothetical protein
MKVLIIIVSVLTFVVILPFSLAWGMIRGACEEVEDLALNLFMW